MWLLILALATGTTVDTPVSIPMYIPIESTVGVIDKTVDEATAIFESFFQEGPEWVPAGVEVRGASLNEGLLTVDVSEEILNYGGNAFEAELVAELAAVAATVPGAEHFSLIIEGQRSPLAEGYTIEAMLLQ